MLLAIAGIASAQDGITIAGVVTTRADGIPVRRRRHGRRRERIGHHRPEWTVYAAVPRSTVRAGRFS
jgi:hypothetical protein